MKLLNLLSIAAIAVLSVSCYLGLPHEESPGGYRTVSSYDELLSAVSNGKNVRLSNDILADGLGYEGALMIRHSLTIDLNGKKLAFKNTGYDSYGYGIPDPSNPSFQPSGSIVVFPNTSLLILGNRGSIESDFFTSVIDNYGTLVVESSAITATGSNLLDNNGKTTINSGTFLSDEDIFDISAKDASLIINDGVFGNGPKSIIIESDANSQNCFIEINGGEFNGISRLAGDIETIINDGCFESYNTSLLVYSGKLVVRNGEFKSMNTVDWSAYDYVYINYPSDYLGLNGDIVIGAEDNPNGNPDVTIEESASLSKGVFYYQNSGLTKPLGSVIVPPSFAFTEVKDIKYARQVQFAYEEDGKKINSSMAVLFMTKEKAESFKGVPGSVLESPESIGPVYNYNW